MNLSETNRTDLKKMIPVHYRNQDAFYKIVRAIRAHLPASRNRSLVVVCIGTDRSTGDALGPLVGMQLARRSIPKISIYGTLEHPVHAVNLNETLDQIYDSHINPFLIAVDACLGKQQNVGNISVSEGPVLPGAGVNKHLPPVGDINITGVVNVAGFMEYSVLQNTRLSIVMNMSETISRCLFHALLSKEEEHVSAHLKTEQKTAASGKENSLFRMLKKIIPETM